MTSLLVSVLLNHYVLGAAAGYFGRPYASAALAGLYAQLKADVIALVAKLRAKV